MFCVFFCAHYKVTVAQLPLPLPTPGAGGPQDIVNQVLSTLPPADTPSTLPPLPGLLPNLPGALPTLPDTLSPLPGAIPPLPGTVPGVTLPDNTILPPLPTSQTAPTTTDVPPVAPASQTTPPPPTTLTPLEPQRPIEDHKCENLSDLETIVSEMTRVIDEGNNLGPFLC